MQTSRDERPHDAVRRVLTTAGIAGAALTLSGATAFSAFADSGHGNHSNDSTGHNPPGNNGTVFIHDVAGDHSPHNVPHVGCTFYADFFGFDLNQSVTVSFAGQAPTGKGTALGGSWTGVVSDDDAGGAGNDFDKELAFTADDLGVTALGAPAHQGYHVKMTVATNEPGGKKSKVFWIQPCAPVVGGVVGGTTGGGVVGGTTSGSSSAGASVSATNSTTGSTTPGSTASVLGEKFTRPASTARIAGSTTALPFTGAEIRLMAAAGIGALGAGLAFVAVGGRRRRSRSLA